MKLTRVLNFLKTHYLFVLILIFSAIILSINLGKPFIGHHDWNSAWYSNQARNFIKYGYLETKFGAVSSYGIKDQSQFVYFTHYPPLLPILISISFRIFGISEQSARLVPLIFSLATITMIYTLGFKFFNKKTAVLASAFAISTPILIYFGKMPVQEVLVIAPVLLSIYLYFNFFEKSNKKHFIFLILSLVFSHLINWPGYYVTPLFALHYLIFSKQKNKIKIALLFPLFSAGMFILHTIHLAILTGDFFGGGLFNVLLNRLNLQNKPLDYTTVKFLSLQIQWLAIYFTRPILILSLIAFIWSIANFKWKETDKKIQLLAMLAIYGITHNLLFRSLAFIHDYMIIYLLPFFAISASVGFFILISKVKIRKAILVFFLAILTISIAYYERLDFTRTLQNSMRSQHAFELGTYLKSISRINDKILVLSPDFKIDQEVMTEYYADSHISYDLPELEQSYNKYPFNNFDFIVAIPTIGTPQNLVEYLENNYFQTNNGIFVVFANKIK